jgi:ADP-ribose pyrophosphatase
MNDRPERLARRVIYENRWVNLYVDKVRFPNGNVIEEHHLVDFDTAAAIVLAENERGELLFVKVCRYTTGRTDWELPAGGVEPGEDPIETARRETLEETGYQSYGHELVYSYFPQDGISNKVYHVVSCRTGERTHEFDQNEVADVRWFSADEIAAMIDQQVIVAGSALVSLFLWFRRKGQ